MTKRLHIEISRDGQKWCDISIESRSADSILADIEAKFPKEQGYGLRAFLEEETRRLVEVTDQPRVIGITYNRTPFPTANGDAS